MNTKPAAAKATTEYRQSRKASGGTAPISKSRITPPANAVANDNTMIPSKSRWPVIAAVAPSTARRNVPARSTAESSLGPITFVNLGAFITDRTVKSRRSAQDVAQIHTRLAVESLVSKKLPLDHDGGRDRHQKDQQKDRQLFPECIAGPRHSDPHVRCGSQEPKHGEYRCSDRN